VPGNTELHFSLDFFLDSPYTWRQHRGACATNFDVRENVPMKKAAKKKKVAKKKK